MTKKTTKTNEIANMLKNLFGIAVADLKKLEDAERNGLAAITAFGTSSENLLRAILPETETPWVFPEDLKPYNIVRDSIVHYAHETGDNGFEIKGSIAGGKYRAAARESDNELVRLSGRLAGRLSTLISNAKKAKESSTETETVGKKEVKKADKKADKGDKVAKAWEEGLALGRGLLACEILEAFPKNKELEKFIKANVNANELATARERRANDAANAAKKKAA